MINVVINGFGRIGRSFLRTVLLDSATRNKIKITAINIGPGRPDFVAHMFKYDTLMGTYPGDVKMQGNSLVVDGYAIEVIAETDPTNINWRTYKVDWVVESSGKFTKRAGAEQHIKSGAQYVLITAPAEGEDVAIIPGVNLEKFDKSKDKIVSLGSCTTNAFIPMLRVLQDAFEIKQGFMTTIHAYTNSQVLLDVEDKSLRMSRAAALNIIPTTTGASKMLTKVMPELDGLVPAMALRVPVGKCSLIDLNVVTGTQDLTKQQVNDAFIKAAKTSMPGILGITVEELVSSDFSGTNYSVVIDGLLTQAQGNMVKVFGWYDNEWGYSERLKDFLMFVA
ncbi:MAG TPA: glyceraldehyde 3-phosphate dehydrogenase NAD-binding domain-containing protein [Candidatus Dependentiae bacterium]|nr:glyceraldehyde 3-phosphate dehydrogenase NAD-binding domain-containing protein [Candidatus Dependentiae bacterium]HRQ62334.1 glyceraldehyde 3-phosphate dehydrogenase NAD-binding domain-containing protein [Candidatus Dependentiae bacterium]